MLFHIAESSLLEVMPSKPSRQFLDRFGAAGSLLCAVHCALLPALLALAPSLGLSFWLSDGVERAVVVFVTAGIFLLGGRLLGLSAQRVMGAFAGLIGQPAILSFATTRTADERVESGYAALFALAIIAKIAIVPFMI